MRTTDAAPFAKLEQSLTARLAALDAQLHAGPSKPAFARNQVVPIPGLMRLDRALAAREDERAPRPSAQIHVLPTAVAFSGAPGPTRRDDVARSQPARTQAPPAAGAGPVRARLRPTIIAGLLALAGVGAGAAVYTSPGMRPLGTPTTAPTRPALRVRLPLYALSARRLIQAASIDRPVAAAPQKLAITSGTPAAPANAVAAFVPAAMPPVAALPSAAPPTSVAAAPSATEAAPKIDRLRVALTVAAGDAAAIQLPIVVAEGPSAKTQIIVVEGLPPGASLSTGMRVSPGTWALAANRLAEARIDLANAPRKRVDLLVHLVGRQGVTLGETAVQIDVQPAPAEPAAEAPSPALEQEAARPARHASQRRFAPAAAVVERFEAPRLASALASARHHKMVRRPHATPRATAAPSQDTPAERRSPETATNPFPAWAPFNAHDKP